MLFKSLSFAFLSLGLISTTYASSMIMSTDSLVASSMKASEGSSDASSSLADDKIVRAAHAEAASFVASNGAIRGARLEAALRHIREQAPQLAETDDLALAQAIVAN